MEYYQVLLICGAIYCSHPKQELHNMIIGFFYFGLSIVSYYVGK